MYDHPQLPVLLQRVATGDKNSLSELYDLTAPWMLGALRNRFANPDVALQITHDVFIQIWQRATQFEHRGQTVTEWMLGVAADLVDRTEIRQPEAAAS